MCEESDDKSLEKELDDDGVGEEEGDDMADRFRVRSR